MPISTADLNKAYLAYFGRPADLTGQSYFKNKELADVIKAFDASAESQTLYGTDTTIKVNAIYKNLFGRDAEPAGLTHWVAMIEGGRITAAGAAMEILNAAQGTDATAVANKLSASAAFVAAMDTTAEMVGYTGIAAVQSAREWLSKVTHEAATLTAAQSGADAAVKAAAVGSAGVGSSFTLTTGQDAVVGKSGNDTFYAHIFDNQNTLQSGDKINGGAGEDTLKADIGNSQKFALTPELESVERVEIRVQANQTDSGDNNIANVGIIDAERSTGVNHWESNNSRGDLVVEDVRIKAGQITKDVTIAFVESDPGHVDYAVYFDQHSLRSQTNTSSTLSLEVLDTRSAAAGTGPLKDSPYHGVAFNVTFPGATAPKLVMLTSQAIDDAKTYEALVTAIQAAIDTNPELAGFKASLGNSFQVFDTLGTAQTGNQVLITTNTGATVSAEGVGTGWIANGAVPPSSGLHTNISNSVTNNTELVTSKIILDDVGRGSNGGDLIVGGLSVGDTSNSKGVERFEIEVRDNSKLQVISSTNNSLKEVVLVNGQTSNNAGNAGSLSVLGEITSGAISGNNEKLPGQTGMTGFTDVRLIDGSALSGDLTFNAAISEQSIGKYLNLKDVQASPSGDNIAFQYTGGAGNDKLNVVVDSSVLASRTLTGREDFTLNVSGGAGNDAITVDIANQANAGTPAWLVDQLALRNVTIDGGSGNDTINAVGEGAFNIQAGTGDDVVYVDNTGAKAAWVVAAQNTNSADLQSAANALGKSFLYKGSVRVTFAAGNESGVTAALAAALDNGFEGRADIPTGENYAVTQYHINQAIKEAINKPGSVLSTLLEAKDGPGTSLVITSKIDGSVVAGDLQITVSAPSLTGLSAAEQSAALEAFKKYSVNGAATLSDAQAAQAATETAAKAVTGVNTTVLATDVTGAASTAENDSVINAGAGNDVIVLSTGANSNSTVAFSGYDLGSTTVVNFNQNGAGADRLDFSSYLTSKFATAASSTLQKTIAATLNADAAVEANSITKLEFTGTAAKTFAGLTAEALLAAINSGNTGAADFANINAATLNAVNSYDSNALVGGLGKAVVLVHNTANHGEYKVFELTFNGASSNAAADFTEAKLITTLDLGESLTSLDVALGLTAPSGGGAGPVVPGATVPVGPGSVPVAATAAADVFSVNVAALLADVAGTNTQTTITGFNVAADKLSFDLPTANAAITTLAQLNGVQGVSVQVDPFAGLTLVNLGNDANGGEVVSISLVGVTDPATVAIEVI